MVLRGLRAVLPTPWHYGAEGFKGSLPTPRHYGAEGFKGGRNWAPILTRRVYNFDFVINFLNIPCPPIIFYYSVFFQFCLDYKINFCRFFIHLGKKMSAAKKQKNVQLNKYLKKKNTSRRCKTERYPGRQIQAWKIILEIGKSVNLKTGKQKKKLKIEKLRKIDNKCVCGVLCVCDMYG